MAVDRQTVDLSAYPDLVVFYLGMRVRRPRGMLRLFGLWPQIQKSWKQRPDGLPHVDLRVRIAVGLAGLLLALLDAQARRRMGLLEGPGAVVGRTVTGHGARHRCEVVEPGVSPRLGAPGVHMPAAPGWTSLMPSC